MTKKRKKRVLAAYTGGPVDYSLTPEQRNMQYMQSLLTGTYKNPTQQLIDQNGPISQQISQFKQQADNNNAMNQMKVGIANSMSGGGEGGGFNLSGALGAASSGLDTLIDLAPGSKSTATTSGQAAVQSVMDVAKGGMKGAQIGMAVGGPYGAAIGAGAGILAGAIGKRGESAEMTSFTDYDEGTLGTGLIGTFTNKRLKRERERIKKNALGNRQAVVGTANLQNEWNLNYGGMNTNTFADGGTIPSSLVYVDDGELINTPDGNITKVAEQGKPKDSNLMDLPVGSKILSDTLKVPGSKDTFAKAGEKIMKKRNSQYNDKYAQNSQMLNDMNNQKAYDDLFDLQEQVKTKKGIKPKTKQLIPAAEDGGFLDTQKDLTLTRVTAPMALGRIFYRSIFPQRQNNVQQEDTSDITNTQAWKDYMYNFIHGNFRNPLNYRRPDRERFGFYRGWDAMDMPTSSVIENTTIEQAPISRSGSGKTNKGKATSKTITISTPPVIEQDLSLVDDQLPEIKPTYISRSGTGKDNSTDNKGKINILDTLSSIGELTPALMNLTEGRPHPINTNYNPYADAILNTVARRRFDINPILSSIRRNRAMANYNANQLATNTGANLAANVANTIATNNAIAEAHTAKNNMDNQYLADYANQMNSLGQQWVNATNLAEDLNRRQYANARNIRRQGAAQISQWLQNRRLMNNQEARDNALLSLYDPMLRSLYMNSDYSNWRNWIGQLNDFAD